jgi:hypothetical protein
MHSGNQHAKILMHKFQLEIPRTGDSNRSEMVSLRAHKCTQAGVR